MTCHTTAKRHPLTGSLPPRQGRLGGLLIVVIGMAAVAVIVVRMMRDDSVKPDQA